MIYFIFIGVVVAYLIGKSPLRCFDQIHFRYPLLIIGALFLQIVLFVIFRLNPVHNAYLLELTMLLLLLGLWMNRSLSGLKWITLGSMLNLVSLLVHKGRMPVMDKALEIAGIVYSTNDARHQAMTGYSIWWLGDWIPLYKVVISIGDLLVGIGVVLFFIMNSPSRRNHEAK